MADPARAPTSVLVTADAVGGVWGYTRELARALAEAGTRVTVALMGPSPSPAQRAELTSIGGLTLHDAPFRLEWMDDPWSDVEAAGPWLLALARDARAEVVHLNGYAHATLPFGVPVVVVAHSCVVSWFRAVRGEEPPAAWDRYREAVAAGVAAASAVVAPTHAMLQEVARCHGTPRRAFVIPNAVAAGRFEARPKEPFVFAAGRVWDEAKNLAALAAIAPELGWPVLIAGDDRHPSGERRLLPGVTALGRLEQDDLAVLYGAASIYALPARYEPFGLTVLEAALSSCALVLGDIPSLRETWGDAAAYVDPGDPDALHAAIRALVDDPAQRAELATRAKLRAGALAAAPLGAAYRRVYRAVRAQLRAAPRAAHAAIRDGL